MAFSHIKSFLEKYNLVTLYEFASNKPLYSVREIRTNDYLFMIFENKRLIGV